MKLKLYHWGGYYIDGTGSKYTVFALAENADEAKQIAISKVKNETEKKKLEEFLNSSKPIENAEKTSFIFSCDAQIIL